MVDTKDLSAFVRQQEYKLQAKIYTKKYEKLAEKFKEEQDFSANELRYNYDSNDGVWLQRTPLEDLASAKSDDALAKYELKFLH